MLERDVEKKLVQGVKKLGGRCYKWVSPGNAGVPDRIVLLPNGVIRFVELKQKNGRLSEIQKVQMKHLMTLGFGVDVLYGIEDVRAWLESWRIVTVTENERRNSWYR